jgi:hypothetical protein
MVLVRENRILYYYLLMMIYTKMTLFHFVLLLTHLEPQFLYTFCLINLFCTIFFVLPTNCDFAEAFKVENKKGEKKSKHQIINGDQKQLNLFLGL